jgi:hypothetical protein
MSVFRRRKSLQLYTVATVQSNSATLQQCPARRSHHEATSEQTQSDIATLFHCSNASVSQRNIATHKRGTVRQRARNLFFRCSRENLLPCFTATLHQRYIAAGLHCYSATLPQRCNGSELQRIRVTVTHPCRAYGGSSLARRHPHRKKDFYFKNFFQAVRKNLM